MNKILYRQGLFFILEAIKMELISCYHDNSPISYFEIERTRKFLAGKYYWPSFRHNNETYVKGFDACLASKAVRYKLYSHF